MNRITTRPACDAMKAPGRPCSRPAIWRGLRASTRVVHMCDHCHCNSEDAAGVVSWRPIKLRDVVQPAGMFDQAATHQIDWITEASQPGVRP